MDGPAAPDLPHFEPSNEVEATLAEFTALAQKGDLASLATIIEVLRRIADDPNSVHDLVLAPTEEGLKGKMNRREMEVQADYLKSQILSRSRFRGYIAEGVLERAVLGLSPLTLDNSLVPAYLKGFDDRLPKIARLNIVLLAYLYTLHPDKTRVELIDIAETLRGPLGVTDRLQEGSTYESLRKACYTYYPDSHDPGDHESFRHFLAAQVEDWGFTRPWFLSLEPARPGAAIENAIVLGMRASTVKRRNAPGARGSRRE